MANWWERQTGKEGLSGIIDPWDIGIGNLFKQGTDTITQKPMKEKWQMDLGERLSGIANQYMGQYEPGKPYEMTAWKGPSEYGRLSELTSPSTYEQQGLDYLQSYIEGDKKESDLTKQARKVLSDTLSGGYDPYSSNYYESIRRNLAKEKEQNIKDLNIYIGGKGLGGSSYRTGGLVDITQGTFDKISDTMAALQESERQKQLGAVGTAMDFEKGSEGIAQNKLSAIMGYGALPRELEGVKYQDFLRTEEGKKALENFLYSDFNRKQGELGGMIDLGKSLFAEDMPYGMKSLDYKTPSIFDEVLDYATQIANIYSAIKGTGGTIERKGLANNQIPSFGGSSGGLNSISMKATDRSNPYYQDYLQGR